MTFMCLMQVQGLFRRRVLRRLIWVCTVRQCPLHDTLGIIYFYRDWLNGLYALNGLSYILCFFCQGRNTNLHCISRCRYNLTKQEKYPLYQENTDQHVYIIFRFLNISYTTKTLNESCHIKTNRYSIYKQKRFRQAFASAYGVG